MEDGAQAATVADEQIDALWVLATRSVTEPHDVLDVVVGVLRASGRDDTHASGDTDAPDDTDAPGELVRRIAGRVRARPPAPGTITRIDGAAGGAGPDATPPWLYGSPTPDQRREIRRRVAADDDGTDRLRASPRRSRRVVTAVAVVAALAFAVVLIRSPPAPSTDAAGARATSGPEPTVVADDVAIAARAAAAEEFRADRLLAYQVGFRATGTLVTDQHLARCANAVRTTDRTAEYPPVSTWSVRGVEAGASGVSSIVSDRFVCTTTESTTYVSAMSGVAAGAVTVVRAGPRLVALLNPDGVEVTLTSLRADTVPQSTISSRQVQSIPVADATDAPSGFSVRVGRVAPEGDGERGADSFDGLLPAPGPTAVVLADRTGERDTADRNPAGLQLARCLASGFAASIQVPGAWSVAATGELPDDTSVIAARAPGMAGLCVRHGERLVFTSFPAADPVPDAALATLTRIGAVGGDDQSYTLFSVDPRARELRAEGPDPTSCVVGGGVGVCVTGTAPPSGEIVLRAYGREKTVVAGPAILE